MIDFQLQSKRTHVIVKKVEAVVVDPCPLKSLWLESSAQDVSELELSFRFSVVLLNEDDRKNDREDDDNGENEKPSEDEILLSLLRRPDQFLWRIE